MNPPAPSQTSRSLWVILLSLAALAVLMASHARAADLKLVFSPQWDGKPIQINHWIPEAPPAGRSVSELRFLISRPAVQRPNGTWQTVRDAFALIDLSDEATASATITGLKEGPFTAIRFDVGVPPTENSADLPALADSHPLNPATCPLKRDGKPGYTFLSLQGLWRQSDGQLGQFHYELAGDPYLARIELPLKKDAATEKGIHIALDAGEAAEDFNPERMSKIKSHPALTTLSFNLRKAFKIIESPDPTQPTAFQITQN